MVSFFTDEEGAAMMSISGIKAVFYNNQKRGNIKENIEMLDIILTNAFSEEKIIAPILNKGQMEIEITKVYEHDHIVSVHKLKHKDGGLLCHNERLRLRWNNLSFFTSTDKDGGEKIKEWIEKQIKKRRRKESAAAKVMI